MQSIQRLSGDDEGEARYNFHDESAAPSVSEERTECFAEAIWGAVNDLRLLWRSLGPRVVPSFHGDKVGATTPAAAVKNTRRAAVRDPGRGEPISDGQHRSNFSWPKIGNLIVAKTDRAD